MEARIGEEAAMVEQESGVGSSGGETNNGASSGGEDSSTFWSSSNSNSYDSSLSGVLHVIMLLKFNNEVLGRSKPCKSEAD